MKYAVLFPGQGSQAVGMCPDLRNARADLFASASDILGWDLERLIADGPDEVLTQTERAQPALYVTSYGLWDEFEALVDDDPVAMAGHSLGEYTALAAAESVSFADGLALVGERGLAMADAGSDVASGMAALIGADEALAEQIAADRRSDGGSLHVANVNAPGQIVVAGGTDDLEWLSQHARDLGVRRAVVLKVSAGFHSPFMADAGDRLGRALDAATLVSPRIPVFANATADITNDPRATLRDQLVAPVRFAATLEHMAAAGVDTFVHIGPGDVTAGLARRTIPDANVHVVSSLVEARNVAESLSIQ